MATTHASEALSDADAVFATLLDLANHLIPATEPPATTAAGAAT